MREIRADVRTRFRALVERAIERSDKEHAAHLAQLRNTGYRRGTPNPHPGRRTGAGRAGS